MAARGHLTPVSIAVLALLAEQPMHAYRMQQLIKERGVDIVVNVRTRSGLHAAIERLTRDGMIRVHAVERDAGYPERTVHELTPGGRDALRDAIRDGVATPAQEFPLFPAAVSFLHLLGPEDARQRLELRVAALRQRLTATQAVLTASRDYGVPRVYLLEHEYLEAVTTTELNWALGVARDLAAGTVTWEPHL